MTAIQNNFGPLSGAYDAARKGYPDEVFAYLKTFVKGSGSRVLDIGCGTGISTRELAKHGFEASGADKEIGMIGVAKEQSPKIPYFVAPTSKLPFEDDSFDLVTAFTAFHWFTDNASVAEIKRVLKPGGSFAAVTKRNRKDSIFEDREGGYIKILHKYAGQSFNSMKDYFPEEVLGRNDFKNVTEKAFLTDESYTVEDALVLNQSFSAWNNIPKDKRLAMLAELREFYEDNLVGGMVVRPRKISIVTGTKQ